MNLYPNIFLILICSLIVSVVTIKVVIKISVLKNLFDIPVEKRKIHKKPIPNLGGFALFFSVLFSISLLSKTSWLNFSSLNLIFAAFLFLFLFGLKDDLVGLSSSKRLIAQLLSGFVVVFFGDFRILNLSLLNIVDLDYSLSLIISVLMFVFITNAYNLIDGINGLLGSVALIAFLSFAYIFYNSSDIFLFTLSIAASSAIIGFLYFNLGNAKIFMGSSGSYIIGSIIYLNSVCFINSEYSIGVNSPKFTILFCILSVPLFDTIRVFCIRVYKLTSPFSADNNHIHHLLLAFGFTHNKIVSILVILNFGLILIPFLFPNVLDFYLLMMVFFILVILNSYVKFILKKRSLIS